jgi:hypothetical protein
LARSVADLCVVARKNLRHFLNIVAAWLFQRIQTTAISNVYLPWCPCPRRL